MATTITANGINFPDGSASAPSIGGTDTNTGLFTGSDIVGFATGGVERIRIDSSGRLIVGTNSARNTRLGTNNFSGLLQIESDSEAAATIGRFNNGAGSSRLVLQKARGTKASPSVVQSGDDCGQILFSGWDGDTFTNAAYIKVEVDGTPGDDDMPGRLIFATTPDGTTTSQERLRITSNGRLLLNTADNSGYSNRSAYFTNPNDNWNYISITGATNGGAGIVFGDSTGQNAGNYESYMYHDNNSNHFYILTDQGNQRFTFDNNGHLGLGPNNTAPSGTIHINDSGQQNLVVGSTNAGGAYLVLDGDSNGDSAGGDYAYIGHDTNGDLILAVDNPAGNGNIFLKSNGASYQAVGCYESGEVQLRYQNSTKLETNSTGVVLTSGAANTTSVRFGNTANRGLYISTYQSAGNNDSGVVFNAADSENNGYSATLEFDLGGVEFGRFDGNYDIFKLGSACNGITFNNDWAAANRLNDYEEGNLTWYLRKSDNTSGGNDNGSIVKYTKVGRLVHISGRIRTDSVSSGSNYVFHLDGSLPFTPSTPGTSVVGHWRSQDQLDSSLTASICWGESNTTIYLYTIDSKSDYSPSANNVPASHQTNLVMTFSFTYQAS